MKRIVQLSLIFGFLLALGGCSVSDIAEQRASEKADIKPQLSSKQPAIKKPVNTTVMRPKVKVVAPYKPEIRPYVDSKPVISDPSDEETKITNQVKIEQQRELDEDPYASIPDSGSSSPTAKITSKVGPSEISPPAKSKSSSAVTALLKQARAQILVGKYVLAESKLERGLRIEAENPELWTLLAKSHYGQTNYSQAINMARKAISFSRNDDLTASNWALVKKAGEKSGDAMAVKDALDYIKANP